MTHPERVEDYLGHIAEAIARATEYVHELPDFDAFRGKRQVQDAVVRNIEIIGEAVNKISKVAPDFVNEHREIPWAQMRAMRNVVIHEYFFVDLKVVWKTVKDDLPRLKRQIDDVVDEVRRAADPGS